MSRRVSAVVMCSLLLCAAMEASGSDVDDVARSLKAHEEPHKNLAAWPQLKASRGTGFRTESAVYVKLDCRPDDGKLSLPRLNNPTKQVYLLGEADRELSLRPEVGKWIITLPKQVPSSTILVVQTMGKPELPAEAEPIEAGEDGVLLLPAHKALTHGEKLRYEPQPHKNTVGYWTNPKDWSEWRVKIDRSGAFEVQILQGCGKGHGGSTVAISLTPADNRNAKSEVVRFDVQDTGHFQNFVLRRLGKFAVPEPGVYHVEVRAERLAAKAVMDVRQIRLIPTK